jgi:hypothetical protein
MGLELFSEKRWVLAQLDFLLEDVILSEAAFQAERRACPERS